MVHGTESEFSGDDMQTVLLANSLAEVTKQDFYTELSRLPFEFRDGVTTSESRIAQILEKLLLRKSLAAEARNLGYQDEPDIKLKMEALIVKALAELRTERLKMESLAEFEEKKDAYSQRAREVYRANPDKYQAEDKVNAAHILIDFNNRTEEEALTRANEVYKLAKDGGSFVELVKEYSDDPTAETNNGDLGSFGKGKMVRPFEEAAFLLEKAGDISLPTKTEFGYHIIRLNGKIPAAVQPFDVARESIINQLKSDFTKLRFNEHVAKINNDVNITADLEAIASLKQVVDWDILRTKGTATQP
jgi:peptidyl-prolyl cis-trans isomerase C